MNAWGFGTILTALGLLLGAGKTCGGEVPPGMSAAAAAGREPTADDGRTRFLLLDSRLIESTENATLTIGTARKHAANPLFGEDRPWERRFDNLYANVSRDAADGQYKCWYSPFIVDRSSKGVSIEQRHHGGYRPPPDRKMGVCYATSRDGLKWEKPELNLVEFEGRKANNLVLRGPHGAGVFEDTGDAEPSRRFKMFHAGDVLRFSADGVHWSAAAACAGIESRGDTHNNLLWVPELRKYAAFVRLRGAANERVVGRAESGDLKQWTKAVTVLGCGTEGQAYSMPVFRYAGVYLGLLAVYRTREDRVHTELAWSPDTVAWQRIQPGTRFLDNSPKEGDYDWGCVYAAAAPIALDDGIRIYYGGSNGKHTGWRDGFLCLATLRPDGWAGYEPVDRARPAVVTTCALRPGGRPLRVTADVGAGGAVKVSLIDRTGARVSAAQSITESVTDRELQWDREVESAGVRLRFELRSAKVYSFAYGPPKSAVEQPSSNPFGEPYATNGSPSAVNMHLCPRGKWEIGRDQWGEIVRVNLLEIGDRDWERVPGVKKAWRMRGDNGDAPVKLENRFVAVEIDRESGAVRSIRDKEFNSTYAIAGIGFEVTTATGTVRSIKALSADVKGGEAVLRFADGGLEVKLHYTLGAEDRFVEKWLETKAADGKPYFLKSVVLEDATTTAFQEIHFHDDQTIWHCPINLFLRGEQGGCFAGLEYPYWELQQKGKEGFRLGYQPNYQAAAGEVNVGEKYFLGVYRQEGIQRVSQGPYPGCGRSPLLSWGGTGLGQHFKDGRIPAEMKDVPPEVLDWGEVWAMQAFMRRVQPDDLALPEDGYWIWQNGWWAGLFDPQPKILDTLKAAGIHDIMTAHTWYGRGNHPNLEAYLYKMRMDPLGFPQDAAVAGLAGNNPAAGWHAPQEVKLDVFKPGEFTAGFKAPPAMQKFIDHGNEIGVHVSSFAVPGLLFEARPEWRSLDEQGKPSQYLFGRGVSCPACDDYMKHALAVHEAVCHQYQPRWWGWDGRWLSYWEVPQFRPGPLGLGADPCFAKNHGHLPGDNRYQEWRNIQLFLKTIREQHPRLCTEAYYGLKRGEPWALRYLNAADNYYETNGADMNRMQAWHNQNDRFRPVYKNYCAVFGNDPASFQLNVLASISCSAYCQIGPGFQGLQRPENREFLQKWRDWATKNHAYLKVKRDLFDCPGDSAVDGSAHIIGDRGFLFLFPGGFDKKIHHAKILQAAIPVNRWLGLDEKPASLYRIKEVYPREGTDLGVCRYGEELLYDLPTGSAVILALEPAPGGSRPQRPSMGGQQDGVLVIPAFRR